MKITESRSPSTVYFVLSVHCGRHRAASAKLSLAPTVIVQPPLPSPFHGVLRPLIRQGDSVLHVWSLRALCLSWANVPYVHACSAPKSSVGASDVQFLTTTASQLLHQIPMLQE